MNAALTWYNALGTNLRIGASDILLHSFAQTEEFLPPEASAPSYFANTLFLWRVATAISINLLRLLDAIFTLF